MRTGRVVVVTGATGGLGSPVCDRFLANDDHVIAVGRDDATLGKFASTRSGSRLTLVSADLTRDEDCARIAQAAPDGRVDVLFNAAGGQVDRSLDETSVSDFRKIVDLNLNSMFAVIKAVMPLMRGRGWGRIINVSSAAVIEGVATHIDYVAAKAGVIGLTRSLARALGAEGVTVNAIAPGVTLTPPVLQNFPKTILDQQVQMRALKRELRPEDLAGVVAFLASPDADVITGQTLTVDAGKQMV